MVLPGPRLNVLHLMFENGPLRQVIVNWEEVAKALLEQLQRAAAWTHDSHLHALISALLGYAGVLRRGACYAWMPRVVCSCPAS